MSSEDTARDAGLRSAAAADAEGASRGEQDATLTFWNFCAELEGKASARAIAVDDVMPSSSAPRRHLRSSAMCSTRTWATKNRGAVDRFSR